jgi:hypothetical protein
MTTMAMGPEGDSEVEIDDDALELASGGAGGASSANTTSTGHPSNFIPFDTSF